MFLKNSPQINFHNHTRRVCHMKFHIFTITTTTTEPFLIIIQKLKSKKKIITTTPKNQ
jgi:hypothetical protein